jgi:hypothetical protein
MDTRVQVAVDLMKMGNNSGKAVVATGQISVIDQGWHAFWLRATTL